MKHITVGRNYNQGKIAFVTCEKSASLQKIDIKDNCFLLILLISGRMSFHVNNKVIQATAPCFLCFDETENPSLASKQKAEYFCIYFHPKFLNINMTFERLRSKKYGDIATTHDMFLLKPFLDRYHVIPILESYQNSIEVACEHMSEELSLQRDWYWSCRGRSYFMEIMIALERMYGLLGYGEKSKNTDFIPTIKNSKLRDAIIFVEGNYMERLTLSRISEAAGINHNSLTRLFKKELGITAMEYLMQYRIKVAKKQLAFTEVPIKEISNRCGFQTVPHFARVFKAYIGTTPAAFRKNAVQKRKNEIK